MDFSPRMKRILQLLLLQTDYLSEQAIADTLSISKRTVQRELDGADDLLAPYGLTLTRKKRAGLLLTGDEEKKAALRASLVTADAMDFTDKVKRRRYLLFELLRDRTPKKLFYYSELLGVSETTAASDLEALSPWLDRNHLSIVKKQGYGVVLNGSEKDYREAMRRFISEAAPTNVRTRDEISSTALAKAVMNVTDKGIYKLLNSQTLEEVYHILDTIDEPRLNKLTETAKVGLVIHIAIAIERIRQGSDTEAQTPPPMADDADTALARRIVAAMEEAFDLVMPDIEVSYLLLHIKGAKVNYTKDEPLPAPIGEKALLDTIDTMIDSFDPALAPQIHRDEEFIQGLFIHLQPTIVRIKHHLNIINPLLEDIKKEYTDVFDKSRRAAQVLEQVLGLPISDEEVGYLTIHFGAALERLKGTTEQTRTVIIGVVCASGFGLARLMLTRLQNKVSQPCVLTAYGKKDLTPDILSKTDFFVSTLILSDIDADVVHSSPLISPSELSRIEGKISEYAHVRRQEEEEIKQLVEEAPTLAAYMDFMKRIKETAMLAMDLVTAYNHFTANGG